MAKANVSSPSSGRLPANNGLSKQVVIHAVAFPVWETLPSAVTRDTGGFPRLRQTAGPSKILNRVTSSTVPPTSSLGHQINKSCFFSTIIVL